MPNARVLHLSTKIHIVPFVFGFDLHLATMHSRATPMEDQLGGFMIGKQRPLNKTLHYVATY